MKGQKLLCFVTTAVVSLHLACGQNVIETIGFGQEADAAREGETGSIRIRLRPQPITVDVSGQVVPLSISQYENYTFATQRTVPQSVQDAINAISDPAEYEEGTDGRRDFNNTVLNFTITAESEEFDVDITTLISEDEVNEAAEQFILVLEADSNEVEFDAQEGILVVTILDNNAIFLNFNISTYTFSESDGTVANVIKVQKNASSPDTEVDIPVQVLTLSGTAMADTDGDIEVESYNRTYTIRINETEVEVDAITIVDDTIPETDEGFTLSLMKGDGSDTLNFFPSISVATITIVDDDVAQVGFTQSIYSVTEGESSFVEVCITLTDGQSLSSSLGYGNFEVLINNTYSSATESDYDAIPSPNILTIERGQEIVCTNITINDDIIVEMLEEFNVSVVAINNTFSAGVTLTQDLASVEIDDNDGAIVGFALSNYTGAEGEAVEVCVTIHSPNQTVLDMSDVEGKFSITGSSGSDTFASVPILVLNSSIAEQCFNLSLLSDGLVEGTEIVTLTLQLNNNIFGIRDIAPNTTVVTIIDEDFAVIGFMQSAYEVNEQSGQGSVIDVCVHLLNGTIAPGVSVNYTLDYDSGDTTQGFLINSTMGVFTAGTTSVCHSVRVLENDVVERNGTITVSIETSSLEPPNTELNISEADVTIIDSDILMVSVEISTSTIMEGASTTLFVTYDGNLHQESTVTVDIITTDGTAKGSDYNLGIGSPHSVTLSTSNLQSEFTVLAVDDQELEDSWETFSVSIALRNLEVMAATEMDKSKVVVTIEDNEELVFSFRDSSYKISEALVGSHSIFVDIENFDSVIIPPLTVGISLSAVVNFMTSNATQGKDYLITNNDREFRNNTQSLDVVIEIKHDLLVEGNEVIYLSLTQPIINGLNSSAAVVRGHRDTVFTILDDDEINVGFNASSHTGEEGDTIIVCVESSDGILGQGITLDYLITAPREDFALPIGSQADTADATSTEMSLDGDYSLTSERVSITANITSRCIEMELINDTIVETDEVFLVQVEQIISSDDLVFTLSTEFTEVTIIDNDEIMIGFETREYQFSENAGFLPTSVYIVRENLVTVSSSFIVTVVLQDHSTATDGTDFMVPGGFNVTIMFGGEDDRKPFPLDILEDMVGEGDETIELLLTTPGRLDGVIPGMNSSTKVVILENDFIQYHYTETEYSFTETAPSSEVCLRIISGVFAPGGYLTLSLFTSTLTAIAGVDFKPIVAPTMVTLTNNTRLVCTNVFITEDELVEGQEMFNVYFDISALKGSYSVNGSNTTLINILDSNVAEVGFKSALYTVVEGEDVMVTVCVSVLSGQLTSVVSLNYSLSVQPLTASENIDYGPNILPANSTLSLIDNSSCHSLPVYDDEGVEPPETFTVTIIPTGPSSEFVALFDVTMLETTVVEIIDNDSLSIGFETSEYTVSENGGSVQLCLMFRGPLKNDSFVELQISLFPYTAGDADYSVKPVPNTLTLNVNNTLKCVSVNITDDNIVEGTEIFRVRFNETDKNQIMIAGLDTIPVFISDDEVIQLQFEKVSYTFSESTTVNDTVITIMIANYDELEITNDTFVPVVAMITGSNATQGDDFAIVLPNGAAVISSEMQSAQFPLNIINDGIVEGVEQFTLLMSHGYINGLEDGAVDSAGISTTVFIEDNDVATIGFNETQYTSAEGVVEVCVSLKIGELQDNVVISYAISVTNTTATTNDFEPLSEEGQISESNQVYCHDIVIVDDNLVESLEDLRVNLLPVFNVAAVQFAPNVTVVTIDDDDAVRVGFEMAQYSVEEAQGTAPITIRIVREDNFTSTHDFNIWLMIGSASSATIGQDFIISVGTPEQISFGQFEMAKDINVTSVHDNLGEGDELIILELTNDINNIIDVMSDQKTTQITIIEDDEILVSFTKDEYSVMEGDTVEVCVRKVLGNLPPSGFVDLLISTASSTAIASTDYIVDPAPNRRTLNETVLMTCFMITTNNDTIVEGTEKLIIKFMLGEKFGSFIPTAGGDTAVIVIVDDDYFELGFEQVSYEVCEGDGIVNDTVYIVKMNDNILQDHYTLTVEVLHSEGPFPAVLNEDFEVDISHTFTVIFETVHTRIPLSFTLLDDVIEEGYENFTLQLSYNETDEDGIVQIVIESAMIYIKDDDVVVIGFERNAYVVFEGQEIEVCVTVLDRELTNDEDRLFTVATSQLTDNSANDNSDYTGILGITKSISLSTVSRQCFMIQTINEEEEEQPEKFGITGTAVSHLIEFAPDSGVIWIVDDDSLLLPVPDISSLNCKSVTEQTTLIVTCTPSSEAVVAEPLLCSVDGEPLRSCDGATMRKRDVEPQIVIVNLLDYQDGLHVLEIIGLTQVTEILRDTVEFYGLAQPFQLECVNDISESGLITVTCNTERVLDSLTCTFDDGIPESSGPNVIQRRRKHAVEVVTCTLKFVIDPNDYDEGTHTVVVNATNLLGETVIYTFSFDSPETTAMSIWDDREFVAAIAIAGVAFIILLLLLLAICLLIFYHRKVNQLNKYGLDLRSENDYVGIGRNLSYRDHDPVQLVEYAPQQPAPPQLHSTQRDGENHPPSQQPHTPSARPHSQQSQASFSRPLSLQSEAPTMRVVSQDPVASSVSQQPLPLTQLEPLPQPERGPIIAPESTSATDEDTEKELLLATGGGTGDSVSHGLKISRRHSVETGKERRHHRHQEEGDAQAGSLRGFKKGNVFGEVKHGAYSIAHGKELHGKEWEDAMQRELEEEMARERSKERVWSRERRREMEQRERRREREQKDRDHRAQERKEREREREVAKERRLAHERDSRYPPPDGDPPTVILHESPESFL